MDNLLPLLLDFLSIYDVWKEATDVQKGTVNVLMQKQKLNYIAKTLHLAMSTVRKICDNEEKNYIEYPRSYPVNCSDLIFL